MRKITILLGVIVITFCIAGLAFAASFNDFDGTNQWIDTSRTGYVPSNGWFKLDFPDSSGGTYVGGSFEYDTNISELSKFDITLYGYGDNSASPIDIYLSFDDKATKTMVASYNVGLSQPFILKLDILSNKLLYAFPASAVFADKGSLSNISLNSFVGVDYFWVGYGCHFYHDKTEVDVQVSPVPEPTTLYLLGLGLVGLGILGRKKFKKN